MGCSSSKSTRDDIELPSRRPQQITVSEPTGGPILVPPPYRDPGGRPIQHSSFELDADTLRAALDDMASFLDQRGVRAQLATVGGAVNTLYLRSRQSTHDIDFFLNESKSSLHHVLHEAARFANRQRSGRLGAEWFNNATQLFMPAKLQQQLFDAAVEQGAKVYDRGGLTVYAGPWPYALCGKLNRLSDADSRTYDLADATVYLHEYFRTSRRSNVGVRQIQKWCNQFSQKTTEGVLRRLDEAYYQTYDRRAIDWNG